ncbi:MAG: S1 RNA-binding domain-containing protein [bacterium]|nr:S1 RNA-binding domain-containing protein [Candidatus Margulisiibacteriota bacterium]
MPIEIGSEIDGKVTGVAKFGAFIELPEGNTGLVHISQVSDNYVTDIGKHLNIGDIVKVKVLGSAKAGKYDLSIKQVGKTVWDNRPKRRPRSSDERPMAGTFEDKITQFLKQSDEKLQDVKRNTETKQGIKKKRKKPLL